MNVELPPRTKKDAHTVILDFIRSRPPLHPVGTIGALSGHMGLTVVGWVIECIICVPGAPLWEFCCYSMV